MKILITIVNVTIILMEIPWWISSEVSNFFSNAKTALVSREIKKKYFTLACFLLQIQAFACFDGTRFVMLPTKFAVSQKFREIFFGLSVVVRYGFAIAITLVGTMLLTIFLQKKKRVRKTVLSEGSNVQNCQQKGEALDSLTVCLIIIATLYFVLIMPLTVLAGLLYADLDTCVFNNALTVAISLSLTNSSINFFIYYWKLAPFRKAVKEALSCGRKGSPKSKSKLEICLITPESAPSLRPVQKQ